tara:strand:+ start:1553 stop:3295 length:1743 start_codon:yes stop_codon:yes gene_type:complete
LENFLNTFENKATTKSFNTFRKTYSDPENINCQNYNFEGGFSFVQYKNLESAYRDIEKNNGKNDLPYSRLLSNVSTNTYEKFNNFVNQSNSTTDITKDILNDLTFNINDMVNLGGLLEKDKIIVTANTRGMFDFSLASQGLFRPVEYFSNDFKIDIESKLFANPFFQLKQPTGIIPDAKVILKDGKFSYKFLGKKYICEQRQTGATSVLNNFSDVCFLKTSPNDIYTTYNKNNTDKVFNGKGKIRLKYASTNKKSYLEYQKKPDSSKYVDIYLPINYLKINTGLSILSIFPALLCASALEKFGIQTRISIMRLGSQTSVQKLQTQRTGFPSDTPLVAGCVSVPVKDYQQNTKDTFNTIINLCGDFKIIAELFGDLKNINENKNQEILQKNRASYSGSIGYTSYAYMINVLDRYKNFIKINPELDYTKVLSPNFMMTSFINKNLKYRTANTANSITNDKIFVDNLHFIFYQFFFNVDYISIELNSLFDFKNQLEKRFEENKYFKDLFNIDKDNIDSEIREYISDILKIKYSVVDNNVYDYENCRIDLGEIKKMAYSDTDEEIKQKSQLLKEKLEQLKELYD